MTIQEIVEEYLRREGYDGLFNEEGECDCVVGDLFPCAMLYDCRAGNFIPCPRPDVCSLGPDEHFHIREKNPEITDEQ